jgi:hypothetical protein
MKTCEYCDKDTDNTQVVYHKEKVYLVCLYCWKLHSRDPLWFRYVLSLDPEKGVPMVDPVFDPTTTSKGVS